MSCTNNTPAASVILPVYNAGEYLDAAIESVLGQSFADFELLLLNDGSTDGSLDRLNHFAAHDTRCKVHSWANRGVIQTLNEGIRLARTDILIRMDADDICHLDRFEKQMAYLRVHPECVAIGSRVMLIDPEGMPIRTFVDEINHELIDAAHLACKGGAIAHPAVAMRKAAVVDIGGYRAEFPHAEDTDLFLRLAEVGRLANLNEVLLEYRQHPSSIGYRHAQAQRDSARRAVAEARQRRGLGELAPLPDDELLPNQVTMADVHRKWSWWALGGGQLDTAKKHAWKAFKLDSLNIENMKLCACVIRGR